MKDGTSNRTYLGVCLAGLTPFTGDYVEPEIMEQVGYGLAPVFFFFCYAGLRMGRYSIVEQNLHDRKEIFQQLHKNLLEKYGVSEDDLGVKAVMKESTAADALEWTSRFKVTSFSVTAGLFLELNLVRLACVSGRILHHHPSAGLHHHYFDRM